MTVASETWTIPTAAPGPWTDEAACLNADPDMFFADQGHHDTADALRLCGRCPVKRDCLDYALDHGQIFGVWGGTTPSQRRGRYRPRDVECGTRAGYERHRYAGEEPCGACREGKLVYDRAWRRGQRRVGAA